MSRSNKRGMMGIGTLVIFIAILLVAAVAAAVMVATSASIQQKALATGAATSAGVASGLETLSVHGLDGSQNSDIERFEMIVRLQPGSDPVNLNNTVIMLDTSTDSMQISYKGSAESTDTTSASSTTEFLAYYVKQSNSGVDNYVSRGDLIKLKFNCPDCSGGETGGIGENRKIRIRVVPRIGVTAVVEFTTPDSILDRRVTLWP